MTVATFVPDDLVEAIVDDRPVGASYTALAEFARQVRALGDGPAPRPSAELAGFLRGGTDAPLVDDDTPALVAVRRRRLAAKVAGFGLVAKIGTAWGARRPGAGELWIGSPYGPRHGRGPGRRSQRRMRGSHP